LKSIYGQHDYKPSNKLTENSKNDESNENMDVCDSDPDSFKSSLECGNIAVPRDLFPYLIISENRKYHLTPEQRSNLKYIPVFYDKDKDECFINIKFKEIQKFIPYKIFKVRHHP